MSKLFAFILILSTMTDCSKNIDQESSDVDIIFGIWQLIDWYDDIARDLNQDGNASTDLFSQWNGCKKESVLELNKDFSGKIIYKGANDNPKCPPGFKTEDSFGLSAWEVNIEEKTFILNGDDWADTYEIILLDKDLLILKGSGFFTCCDPAISNYTGGYLKFKRL